MQTYYFNRLPHYTPIAASYFITFRLQDSLPQKIFIPIKQFFDNAAEEINRSGISIEEKELRIQALKEMYFSKFESQLDNQYGECHLGQPEIATSVISKLQQYDKKYYDLYAYTIMPNHVHFLIDTAVQSKYILNPTENDLITGYKSLPAIIKLIKGGSAMNCNKILNRYGTFWAPAYFDRYIRNENHWRNTILYIINNPVKAGLVKHPEDYLYSWVELEP